MAFAYTKIQLIFVVILSILSFIDLQKNIRLEDDFETRYVTLRDGVKLAVDVYSRVPNTKYPVILELTPYGRGPTGISFRNEAEYWFYHGYVFVIADCRGTGDSEGEMDFFVNEGEDGYDLIEWISQQDWSNGKVGMRGSSYTGTNQWLTASKQPKALKCITPSATLGIPIDHIPYRSGAFAVGWALSWIGRALNLKNKSTDWTNPSPSKWITHKPLNTLDLFASGRVIPLYRKFLEKPLNDPYWKKMVPSESEYAQINIPILAFTGWFDGTMYGTIMHFNNVNKNNPKNENNFIIVGPYTHLNAPDGGYDFMTGKPILKVGDFDLKENAVLPGLNMTREFYDWCLKGASKPNWKRTSFYIPGSDEWIKGDKFMPEGLIEKYFYLSSSGSANTVKGNGKLTREPPKSTQSDSFVYNPNNPVMSDAIPNLDLPVDINFYLNRSDFLVYTSDVLEKPLTIIGEVTVELSYSATTKDTDFVVFLMDVFEDGRSVKLGSFFAFQMRTRYRNGLDKEELMEPGKMYSLKINLHEIGHTFLSGHRIRLAITSSFYPWIDANPNTGNPLATDTSESITSEQTIFNGNPKDGIISRVHFMTLESENNSSPFLNYPNLKIFYVLFFLYTCDYFM